MATVDSTSITHQSLTEMPKYLPYAALDYKGEYVAAGERHVLAHGTDPAKVIEQAEASGLPYMFVAIR